ncbi:hypothetical protein QQF64_000727 [Cirrhinus molitorella]|uniref:Uncharacterized protein n=1 Tax=Cirrhinus molitorella TaxID=172907 RepID=A0ABR3NY05_9TELE
MVLNPLSAQRVGWLSRLRMGWCGCLYHLLKQKELRSELGGEASTSTRRPELSNPRLVEVWVEPLWAPDRPMRSRRCGCRQCLAGWMAGVLCHFLGHGESRRRQMSKKMSVV